MNRILRYLLVIVFAFALSQAAVAATFTVSKIADTNDGTCDADCSLREAVAAAVSAAGDDVIQFDSGVFGSLQTITLNGTNILITNNGTLSINGPGAQLLTVSGNNSSRIFTNDTGAVTVISGMTLSGGNGASTVSTGRAGAIYNNAGNLTLNDMIITGNTAANGGGLNNAGTGAVFNLNNCVVSNNTSTGSGGGMQNFSTSTLNINRTTVSGNMSGSTTGGGGGQFNGTVTITNSTFANNTASTGSGGAFQSNGTSLVITNSTISGNTATTNAGGIHRGTTNVNIFLRNTIVSGNNGVSTSPDVTASASISSEGNNVIGIVGTSTGWVASDLLNMNPMLGPFADNGGFNMTFLPLTGSPAINAGNNCVVDLTCATNNPPSAVTADQRGFVRPSGASVDIGSVEIANAPAFAAISGRVLSTSNYGAGRSLVSISNMSGVVQVALTNNFGYFSFTGIPTGQTYTLSVVSKQYSFTPQNIAVNGDISGLMITAQSGGLGEIDQKK